MIYCPHCNKPSIKDSGPCPHCGKDLNKTQKQLIEDEKKSIKPSEQIFSYPEDDELAIGPSLELAEVEKTDEQQKAKSQKEKIKITEEEIRRIANYGNIPNNFFKVILYSFNVKKRKGELRKQLNEKEERLVNVKDKYIEQTAELGKNIKNKGFKNPRAAAMLKEIETLEGQFSNTSDIHKEEEEKYLSIKKEYSQKINEIEKNMEPIKANERDAASRLKVKQTERRNVEMKLKRVEIEKRNIEKFLKEKENKLMKPEPGEDIEKLRLDIKDYESKLVQKNGEQEALQVEMRQYDAPIADLEKELAGVQAKIAELDGEKKIIADQQKKVTSEQEKKVLSQTEQEKKIEKELKVKLSLFGEFFLSGTSEFPELNDSIKEIKQQKEKLLVIERELDLYRSALASYDAESYKKGFINLSIIVALLIVCLIVLIFITK